MLFKPTLYRKSARELSAEELKNMDICLLLLDADNTLRRHHDKAPCDWVEDFIKRMKQAGISLIITSNAKAANVAEFANAVGLPFYALCKKPLPFKIRKIIRNAGIKTTQAAIVGDQLFTDILCAKLAHIRSVLVSPIELENKWNFKIRRAIERPILRRITK